MISIAQLAGDLLGQTATVVSGLAATASDPASLSISLAAGSIYQLADIDATTDGAISQNTTQILQQGIVGAQTITLETTSLAAGQSQWQLIEAQFSQSDVIRSGDPNGGLLYFYNSTTPTSPFEGPNGDGATTPTERKGLVTIQVITGSPATTGSETPPTPSEGWTPLYLIDLSYGQTTIIQSEIHQAGPSVGTGVPDNYQAAPFLAGLTNSHHGGVAGQAPQIKLASEVQGTLPLANLPASDTYGEISAMQIYAGNPNGYVAGNAANGAVPPSMCWDSTDSLMFVCTTSGTASTAVWQSLRVGTYSFNLSAPPASPLSLLPGEKLTITFSDVSSIPLHVASVQGVYKAVLVLTADNTDNCDMCWKPNDTTYSGAFNVWGIANSDDSVTAFGSATTAPTNVLITVSPYIFDGGIPHTRVVIGTDLFYFDQFVNPTEGDGVNSMGPTISEYVVCTTTTAKMIKQSSGGIGGPATTFAQWTDTVTPWTSLGTLVDLEGTSLSGYAIVERMA